MSELFKSKSGATSSYSSAPYFYMPGEGIKLTALRFKHGNDKHEHGDSVYANANWLKAVKGRDWQFFRDRAGHVIDHIWAEMRGEDDPDPGGNLGAIGWWLEAMAYVKKVDPLLYQVIQGKVPPSHLKLVETEITNGDYSCEISATGQDFNKAPLAGVKVLGSGGVVRVTKRCQDHVGPCTCRTAD